MTTSGIANATGSAGEWGSRFRVGGSAANSKLGAPLILDAGNPVGIIIPRPKLPAQDYELLEHLTKCGMVHAVEPVDCLCQYACYSTYGVSQMRTAPT